MAAYLEFLTLKTKNDLFKPLVHQNHYWPIKTKTNGFFESKSIHFQICLKSYNLNAKHLSKYHMYTHFNLGMYLS